MNPYLLEATRFSEIEKKIEALEKEKSDIHKSCNHTDITGYKVISTYGVKGFNHHEWTICQVCGQKWMEDTPMTDQQIDDMRG